MTRKKSTELALANQTTALATNNGPTFKDFSKFIRLSDAIVDRREELERACNAMLIGSREAPSSKVELHFLADEEEMIAEAKGFWQTFNGEHLYDANGDLLAEEIMLRIASTVGSVKVTGSTPEAFNERLVDHVSDIEGLTWPALESACRELEAEFKFLSISEAVSVVKRHVDLWDTRKTAMLYLKSLSGRAVRIFDECELKKVLQRAENEEWKARSFLDNVSRRMDLAEKQIKDWELEIGRYKWNIEDSQMNIDADKGVLERARSALEEATSKKNKIMQQIDEAKNGSK